MPLPCKQILDSAENTCRVKHVSLFCVSVSHDEEERFYEIDFKKQLFVGRNFFVFLVNGAINFDCCHIPKFFVVASTFLVKQNKTRHLLKDTIFSHSQHLKQNTAATKRYCFPCERLHINKMH